MNTQPAASNAARTARALGVCSWSLRPQSPDELAASVARCGVRLVQLHLDPIRTGAWNAAKTVRALSDHRITIRSGMMSTKGEDYSTLATIRETGGLRPDQTWQENLAAAKENAALASDLGIDLVTFHAGFLPHERNNRERSKLLDRLASVAACFAAKKVRVAFETGQESAPTLLEVLADLRQDNVGVNFDPANMILYGMGEPIEALRMLLPHVMQVHIKDALPTATPGEWGSEVRVGTGRVDWRAFFDTLASAAPSVSCMIEREAGEERVADISHARELCRGYGIGV